MKKKAFWRHYNIGTVKNISTSKYIVKNVFNVYAFSQAQISLEWKSNKINYDMAILNTLNFCSVIETKPIVLRNIVTPLGTKRPHLFLPLNRKNISYYVTKWSESNISVRKTKYRTYKLARSSVQMTCWGRRPFKKNLGDQYLDLVSIGLSFKVKKGTFKNKYNFLRFWDTQTSCRKK